MNRPIKFRAWDNINNKYRWPWPEGFSIIGEVTVFNMLAASEDDERLSIEDYNKIVIEQYTGVKDKNNKMMWEGDIGKIVLKDVLVDGLAGGRCIDLTFIGAIEYHGCEFGINEISVEQFIPLTRYSEIEIIGNIHSGEKS